MAQRVTVYDKRGNPLDIDESVKGSFIGNGYYEKPPTKVAEIKPKEEVANGN